METEYLSVDIFMDYSLGEKFIISKLVFGLLVMKLTFNIKASRKTDLIYRPVNYVDS